MFSEFELKNFEKRIRKFLYKDKNKKNGVEKKHMGWEEKNSSKNALHLWSSVDEIITSKVSLYRCERIFQKIANRKIGSEMSPDFRR
jgi:hypothetical protein